MQQQGSSVAVLRPAGLLTTPEAASALGVSLQFVEQDRLTRRHGIPFVRIGRAVRYRQADLDAYIERNLVREPEAA